MHGIIKFKIKGMKIEKVETYELCFGLNLFFFCHSLRFVEISFLCYNADKISVVKASFYCQQNLTVQ